MYLSMFIPDNSGMADNIFEVLQSIAMYFSSLFSALTTAFRFMLQSSGFVAGLLNYMPTLLGICATVVIAVAIIKAIFGR